MVQRTNTLLWLSAITLLLCALGLAGSIYLTITHFAHISLVCPENSSCDRILTSNTSHFIGIPVPILGIAYFVPMLILCLPFAWKASDRRVHLARLLLSVAGIAMVIYLFIEELFIIKALCVWCSVIHFIGFLLFLIIVTSSPMLLAAEQTSVVPDVA
jgi:uncharacterized membrane protein